VALMLKGRNAAASLYVNPVISGCIPGAVFRVSLVIPCAATRVDVAARGTRV
jgi:hypothetical protein